MSLRPEQFPLPGPGYLDPDPNASRGGFVQRAKDWVN